ncbi:magnesium chelatase subunit D [Limnohabitans sp. Rim8]|uniref:magnesium chelatase subunit D n=1 Tax=Limnohabitans sp. Rim8 TaxID=1100718 RepID=UPI0025D3508F|nr:magnesium chelatase subunit D [Limnohabitans sp. Rim8]
MAREAPPPSSPSDPLERWNDALTTLQLLQLDPFGFGGVCLRAPHGPVRERWLHALAGLGIGLVKVPGSVDSERLLGGIDLAHTLQTGQLHLQAGLLQQADQGMVCLPMAERLSPALLAPLVQALEQGQVPPTRHNAAPTSTRFGVVALDESLLDEPGLGAALAERLGVWLDLNELSPSDIHAAWQGDSESDGLQIRLSPGALDRAREQLPQVQASDEQVQALCAAALGLGIGSLRVPSLALRVACGHAALNGRSTLDADDLGFAARSVLAPRATQWPAEPSAQEAETEQQEDTTTPPEPPEPPENSGESPENAAEKDENPDTAPPPEQNAEQNNEPSAEDLQEMMVAAALASLPPHMLDALMTRQGAASHNTSGRSGQTRAGSQRGRPLPPRPGRPGGQARLHVLATLRAAAPKQRLRQAHSTGRVAIRAEDFHIQRYQQRASSCLILALDASGSAALQRLAEAKGAVELLLQQSYARRDSVCIVAFRGAQAQLLLPMTRSLVRAKRAMTGLPGGGGTPLALALKMAHEQAAQLQRQGVTPILVVLSDGRANVTLQGLGGRAQAQTDAQNWGQQWRASGHRALWIDTSMHPDAQAQQLAATMGASYLPMPQVQSQRMAHAIERVRSPLA